MSALAPVQQTAILHGAFVNGAEMFDADKFNISAAEAGAMDPQQRLLLEMGYSAMHSSALRLSSLIGDDSCMTVGVEEPEWQQVKQMVPSLQRAAYGMGDAMSVVAGRLSFVFGSHGLCTSVDAACASALVALQHAAQTVRQNESGKGIAFGISFKLLPYTTLAMSLVGVVSADGRCKTFDARANGMCRAEGVTAQLISSQPGQTEETILTGIAARHGRKSECVDVCAFREVSTGAFDSNELTRTCRRTSCALDSAASLSTTTICAT